MLYFQDILYSFFYFLYLLPFPFKMDVNLNVKFEKVHLRCTSSGAFYYRDQTTFFNVMNNNYSYETNTKLRVSEAAGRDGVGACRGVP